MVMADELYDASDREHVDAARKGERRSQIMRRDMIVAIMGIPQGREWVWDLLVFTGVNNNPLTTQSELTHANIGMQNVGRYILADITSQTPDLYIQMLKEKQDVRRQHNDSGRRPNGNKTSGGDGDQTSGNDGNQVGDDRG